MEVLGHEDATQFGTGMVSREMMGDKARRGDADEEDARNLGEKTGMVDRKSRKSVAGGKGQGGHNVKSGVEANDITDGKDESDSGSTLTHNESGDSERGEHDADVDGDDSPTTLSDQSSLTQPSATVGMALANLDLAPDDPVSAEAARLASKGLPILGVKSLACAPSDSLDTSATSSVSTSSSPPRTSKKTPSMKSVSSLAYTDNDSVTQVDPNAPTRKMVRRVSFHDGPPDVTEAPDYGRRSEHRPEPVGLIDTVRMMRFMSKMRKQNVEEQARRAQSMPPSSTNSSISHSSVANASTVNHQTTRPRAATLPSQLAEPSSADDASVANSDDPESPTGSDQSVPSSTATSTSPLGPVGADVSWDGRVGRGRPSASTQVTKQPHQQSQQTTKPQKPTALARLLSRAASPARSSSTPPAGTASSFSSSSTVVPSPTFPPKISTSSSSSSLSAIASSQSTTVPSTVRVVAPTFPPKKSDAVEGDKAKKSGLFGRMK
ncbi:hypothetical protein HDU93_008289 [Gonapodya sp. JEL0774]|nr:hypothetical protein HDU93_008289 [Gonapodya sp. JEL0774]